MHQQQGNYKFDLLQFIENIAPNEVTTCRLSRTFLKNDNYHFANQIMEIRNKAKQIDGAGEQNKKCDGVKSTLQQRKSQPIQMHVASSSPNFEDAFSLQPKTNTLEQVDFDSQLKSAIMSAKTRNKDKQKEAINKGFMFVPKCTLNPAVKATQQQQKHITWKLKAQLQRKNQIEKKKFDEKLRLVLKAQQNQSPIKKFNTFQFKQKETEDKPKLQLQKLPQKLFQQHPSSQTKQKQPKQQINENEEKKAKTTGKKKKIKKQTNFVKLDLKRKYRDRFVGGVSKNLRMLTKGGKMKKLHQKDKLKAQLQLDEKQLYNSYTISLSKALFVTLNIDGDSDQQQGNKLRYELPQSYEKQNIQKLMHDIFGFTTFRQGQYETIRNTISGKSTLFVSETASGKSMTYLLSSIIMKGLSIVISPLVSLMLDQIDHLPQDLPAACISSLLNHDQKDRIITMVKQGKIQLLYITPESFLTDFMYHVRQFPSISFVCIDEAHSMSQLSHSFRAAYLTLEDIVLKHFVYKAGHPVVLCLTATANSQTQQSICQKLKIKQTIRSNSVINKNLFVTISRQRLKGKYQALLNYLNHSQIRKCKGILVYCRTKWIMTQVFNYLQNSGMPCSIYHSGLQQKQKVETLQKFRKGVIRIVIATVALGMGLDFENLQCVIHINMPKSVQNYIQQIGRAGRRQKRAYCHLFLDKYDYFTQRNYFLADELQPKIFQTIISALYSNTPQNKRGRIKQSQQIYDNQAQSLKRLSINDYQQQPAKNSEQIYFEEQQDKQQQKLDESRIITNKKQMSNQKQHSQNKIQEKNNQEEQINIQNFEYKPLGYCKANQITQKAGLKQQAILNILLKIQKNLGKQLFKVFPMSYQTIKIGYFKKNEQQIKSESDTYCQLIQNCKVAKGTIYVPLIQKCNQLKLTPIRLLSQIYGFSNKYCLKIQPFNEVFVWQHQKSSTQTINKLRDKQMFSKIVTEFNMVQRTSLTKFNIFYCLCFDNSQISVHQLIKKNKIINDKQSLPQNSIIKCFDQYFQKDTYKFYSQIVKTSKSQSNLDEQLKNQNGNNQQAQYLPIKSIDQESLESIDQNVQVFLQNVLVNNPDKKFMTNIAPYRDGRIITRVFLGVNDTSCNWKTYGQHPYWMKFVDKDYRQLLKTVRKCISNYITRQGPRFLQLEDKGVVSVKKHQKNQNTSSKQVFQDQQKSEQKEHS